MVGNSEIIRIYSIQGKIQKGAWHEKIPIAYITNLNIYSWSSMDNDIKGRENL